MGVYVHFTDEQKYRANNVDLADFLQRRGEKLLPSGRDKRLASDHSITVRGNEWYDHSAESGGYAIDFVRKFYGCSYPEAVTLLLGGEQGEVYRPASQKKQELKKPFALPPAHTDMRRVYAYLVKTRHIGREVVSYFAKQKLLYESCEKSKDETKEYHNAGFAPWGRRIKEMWTAAIPATAFTGLAKVSICMCLKRRWICCRLSPCIRRIGSGTAMCPSVAWAVRRWCGCWNSIRSSGKSRYAWIMMKPVTRPASD